LILGLFGFTFQNASNGRSAIWLIWLAQIGDFSPVALVEALIFNEGSLFILTSGSNSSKAPFTLGVLEEAFICLLVI